MSQHRYFKLVAARPGKTEWQFEQFMHGRAHFGWSPPGTDLRKIRDIKRSHRDEQESITWRYTQFLLNRLRPGDRLVLQFDQPLRQFLLAEVSGEYGTLDVPEDDFNHYVECIPLTDEFIDVQSNLIPQHVRHDVSKRGHYYEIYSTDTIDFLDRLIEEKLWTTRGSVRTRTVEDEVEDTRRVLVESAIQTISKRWKANDFESFVAHLFERVPGVSVKKKVDSRKGWDLTLTVRDPLTDAMIHDDVPVQCKNYTGNVNTDRPLSDLERSIRNSSSDLAYLVIMGEMTEEYRGMVLELEKKLSNELDRSISLRVVDQERVADLYLQHVACLSTTS